MLCLALLLVLFPFLFDTGHRTWIIGDSIINWSGHGQPQLSGGGKVYWDGVSGAKIAGVVDRLSQCVQTRPFPSTLVLHLGTNDIFESPIHEIRKHINLALKSVRNLFPRTRLIWSFILPRSYYHGELRKGAGDGCARNINNHARSVCSEMPNTHVISHKEVLPKHVSKLYRFDGLHLSPRGISIFRSHLEQALTFFNANPGEFQYPRQCGGF